MTASETPALIVDAQGSAHTVGSDDPVWAAYRAAVPGFEPAGRSGVDAGCGRCGAVTATMIPVRQVISARFTAYRSWTNITAPRLCAACAWVYRTPALRRVAHRITRIPSTIAAVSAAELNTALRQPIGPDTALTVPTAGRKHLIPDAAWATVCVDGTSVHWTGDDGLRLAAMTRLRGHGFGEHALAEPEPSYRTLTGIEHHHWEQIFDDWTHLEPWRTAPPWWQIAVRASRPAPQPTTGSRS